MVFASGDLSVRWSGLVEVMINIDSSHPDLLHSDSRDLVILDALTNLRLEWGDLDPLYAEIEMWMSSEYRPGQRAADGDLWRAIRRTHAAGDEDNVIVR